MARAAASRPGRQSNRQQLPEEVAAYVREQIISGRVQAGEFLRLEPIAEAVGVSNTPVREGLLTLRSEGFVRLVPRRGFMVEPFTPQDVNDLFWAQARLAGELAARAAKNITHEELEQLRENVELYAQRGQEPDAEITTMGHGFHRSINLAARSGRLALLLGAIARHLPNSFYAEIEGRVKSAQSEHPAILQALEKRDARAARKLMEEHIQGSGVALIEMLTARGVWQNDGTTN